MGGGAWGDGVGHQEKERERDYLEVFMVFFSHQIYEVSMFKRSGIQ